MSKIKQVIIWRTDLQCRKGKFAAQIAHASMAVFFDRMSVEQMAFSDHDQWSCDFTPEMIEWKEGLFTKIVVGCNSEAELLALHQEALDDDIVCSLIQDCGLTEFKQECPDCKGEGWYIDSRGITPDIPEQFQCERCNGTGKINKPTYTAVAIGPDTEDKINNICSHLKLL